MFFEDSNDDIRLEEDVKLNVNTLMESFIIDELSKLPPETIQEFCKPGGLGDQLVQEGKLRNTNTIVKMAKKDDLTRRINMACLQLAKENNDPDWDKLLLFQQKKKKYKNKIIKKWYRRAERIAKKTQQEFLKGGPKGTGILPNKFKKFGGDERISKDD